MAASDPWVIAHRGASASHPENTRAAFDAALAEGCDGIELDVQLSADGVPFVFHDRTLSRIGGGRRRASSLTIAELKRVDAGSWFHPRFHRERILTLDEVLGRYGGRALLLVELKVRPAEIRSGRRFDLARAVAALLRARRMERTAALLCFDLDSLLCARREWSAARLALNLKTAGQVPGSVRAALPRLWALSFDVRSLAPSHVRVAHESGAPALVFTCNTARKVGRAVRCGADAVMSDRPAWLREILTRSPR